MSNESKKVSRGRSKGFAVSTGTSVSESMSKQPMDSPKPNDSRSQKQEHTTSVRTVVVSIGDNAGEQASISGTSYHDVLRKIERLREMALEGLAGSDEIPF